MPTYSYKCTECDTAFDIHQEFSDESLTQCPTCGGRLRKVFNSIGVTFNGSGFYRTDSRAAAGKKAGSGAHSTQKSASTGSTGSDSGGSSTSSDSGSSSSGSSISSSPAKAGSGAPTT